MQCSKCGNPKVIIKKDKKILNQVFEYIRDTYISAISDTDECTGQMLDRFSEHFKFTDLCYEI